jgi:antitoxin VapB
MLRKPPQEAPVNEIKSIKAEHIELRHDEDGAQVIVLPEGFELPEGKVTIRKDGDRVIIEPSASDTSWAELLDKMETIDVEWPDIDEHLPPLDDVRL